MKHDICFLSCHHWNQEFSSKWQQARIAFTLTKIISTITQSAQALINPFSSAPQISKLYIYSHPRYLKLQIYHKATFYFKQLKYKLSSRWKKRFNSSKNKFRTNNMQHWGLIFFFLASRLKYVHMLHTHTHTLSHLKKKLNTPSWKMEHFFWKEGRF